MCILSLGQEDPLEEDMATPLQFFCLGSPINRGAWWATSPCAHKELDSTEQHTQQHTHTHTHTQVYQTLTVTHDIEVKERKKKKKLVKVYCKMFSPGAATAE